MSRLIPDGVTTRTSTVEKAEAAGDTAVTVVSLTTTTFVADTFPKSTWVAPVRWLPITVMVVPPADGP